MLKVFIELNTFSEDGINVDVGIIVWLGDDDGMKDVGILDIVAETDGAPVIDGYCDPDGIIDSFIVSIE